MGSSFEKSRAEIESLVQKQEEDFDDKMQDLFSNETTGLHAYFQINENNRAFIAKLVEIDNQLTTDKIFDEAMDSDGIVDGKRIVDILLQVFHSFGDFVHQEKNVVFDDAGLSKEDVMAKIQRTFVGIAKMFENSDFPAEEYFLGNVSPKHLVGYNANTEAPKTHPPRSLMDVAVPSSAGVLRHRQQDAPRLITASFETEAILRDMLVQLQRPIEIESYVEDHFVERTLPEIRRVIDVKVRQTTRAYIRRVPHDRLDDIILRGAQSIITSLQNSAIQEKDKLVSQIVLYFYKPGKDHLRIKLEKEIYDSVASYFRAVHASPKTMVPGRTPTKRPSHPSQNDLTKAVHQPHTATQRPPDFVPEVIDVVDQIRSSALKQKAPAIDMTGYADDEPTGVTNLPAQTQDGGDVSGAEKPDEPASPQLANLFSEEDEKDTAVQRESKPVFSSAILSEAARFQRNAPKSAVPASGQPAIPDTERAPAAQAPQETPAPLPAAAPSVIKPSIQPSKAPVVPPATKPKTTGFFSKAKKWFGAAVFAAAAALGIYSVTQNQTSTNQEPVPAASSSSDTSKNLSSVPSVSVKPVEAPVVSTTPTVSKDPAQIPQVSNQTQDVQNQAKEVASVLGSQSYDLGVANGAVPFTGTASVVEGGVDATPFSSQMQTSAWYQGQQTSAELLMKVYDSNKSRLDSDTVRFIESHEKAIRDLASQSNFNPLTFKSKYEMKYSPQDIFGGKGVYNFVLAFQRVLDLYGKDAKKLEADKAGIKLVVGGKFNDKDERYARAVVLKSAAGNQPAPANMNGPVPTKDSDPQKAPQQDGGKSGFNLEHGPNHPAPVNILTNVPSIDAPFTPAAVPNSMASLEHEARDVKSLREQLNGKMAKLFEKAKQEADRREALKAREAKEKAEIAAINRLKDQIETSYELDQIDAGWDNVPSPVQNVKDDAPEIEIVSSGEMTPAEVAELDRRSALMERGEIVLPPLSDGETESVLLAVENGFMKECSSGEQMDRVRDRVSKIRLGSLEAYDVLTNGKIYAKIATRDLEELRQIVS